MPRASPRMSRCRLAVEALELRRTRPAPSPLAGEGWGEGWQQTQSVRSPPSLSLPHKGGWNVVAMLVATRTKCLRQAEMRLPKAARASVSFDGDVGSLGLRETVVAGPLELDRAARGRDCEERDERIGGDRREQIGAEYFQSVIGAHELGDDVARDRLADIVVPVAGLHLVRDQRLDRDDLALLGLGRNVDEGASHQTGSSRQAAMVTMTSTSSDQKLPSFISAIAKMRCESASRTRVESLACPAGGPSRTLTTFDCGFFSLNTWIART